MYVGGGVEEQKVVTLSENLLIGLRGRTCLLISSLPLKFYDSKAFGFYYSKACWLFTRLYEAGGFCPLQLLDRCAESQTMTVGLRDRKRKGFVHLSCASPTAGSTSAFTSFPKAHTVMEVGPHAREGCALEQLGSSKKYRHLDPSPDLSFELTGRGA